MFSGGVKEASGIKCMKHDLLFEVLFENFFIKSLKHSSSYLLINVSYLIFDILEAVWYIPLYVRVEVKGKVLKWTANTKAKPKLFQQ